MTPTVLPARSVDEIHLYLDLQGCDREGREHRLEDRDGDLVAVYACTRDGEPVSYAFQVPDTPPAPGQFGVDQPSRLVDAGQFLLRADRLAATVPADASEREPALRAAAARRLETAARCLDEVLAFYPEGDEEPPPDAFWTPIGKLARDREPGRFRRSRLQAVAGTYRRIAARLQQPGSPEETDRGA